VSDLLHWNETRLSVLFHPNLIQASVIQEASFRGYAISIAFILLQA
jgi:hypothetical protein